MATTVIESLIIELGLDPSKFTKGQRDAVAAIRQLEQGSERAGKNVEAHSKKLLEFFTRLKTQALTVLGFTGVKDFIDRIVQLDLATGNLSRTTEISTRELSAWDKAGQAIGGRAGGVSSTIAGLDRELQKFLLTGQGGEMLVSLFNHLGISAYKANGAIKTTDELLLEIAGRSEAMAADPRRRAALLSMIPGMSEDSINLIIRGRGEVEKLLEKFRAAGTVTAESAKAAQEYNEALINLQTSADSLGRTLLYGLAKPMSTIMDIFTAMLQGNIDLWGTRGGVSKQQEQDARKRLQDQLKGAPAPGAGAVVASSTPRVGMTRGDRNNNPGNIEYGPFAIKHGAVGTDGRFAIFPDKSSGIQAMASLLNSNYQGLTLEQIQKKWVGYTDQGYLQSMMRSTGLTANAVPDLNSNDMVAKIMRGMSRGEGTSLGVGAGVAAGNNVTNRNSSNSSTSSTTIGTVNIVVPNATDADSIAKGIKPALQRSGFAAQGNYALQG